MRVLRGPYANFEARVLARSPGERITLDVNVFGKTVSAEVRGGDSIALLEG